MNRFARWIVKHRVAVVIICLLMLIPSVLGMNATKVKYDLLYYLPEDLDTVKGQNILMEEFGKGAFSLCITEGMSETDQQALEDAIRDVPHVDTVIGYASITKGTIPSEILPDEYRNIFEKGDAWRCSSMIRRRRKGRWKPLRRSAKLRGSIASCPVCPRL